MAYYDGGDASKSTDTEEGKDGPEMAYNDGGDASKRTEECEHVDEVSDPSVDEISDQRKENRPKCKGKSLPATHAHMRT